MRALIQTRKHYVQMTLQTVTAGTSTTVPLAFSQENPADADEVTVGAVVKAVFIELWVRGGDTSPGSILVTLVKVPDGQTPTFADMIALHDYKNKKNVLYHTQGLTNINTDGAIPFSRQWYKIPKGKQRMGLGDSLYLVISAQALDSVLCGFATYKEYI